MKKLLSLLLSIVILITAFTALGIPASAESSFYDAIKMNFNTNYSNYTNSGDVYYKITATSKGKIDIKFNHEYNSEHRYWRIGIYKQNSDGLYDSYCDEITVYTYGSAFNFPSIGVNKGDVYFIKVRNGWNSQNIKFTVSTKFTKTNYFEREFNNTFYKANTLTLNKSYSGNCFNDDDYFKIVVPASGTLNINFKHQYNSNHCYWKVSIYKQNRDGLFDLYNENTVYAYDSKSLNIKVGNVKKSQTYYVLVKNGWNVDSLNYTITPTLKIENPGTPNVAFNGNKATIKWIKASGVTGYQIQIARNVNFKKTIYSQTTTKNQISKILSYYTIYHVRVRAYKKVGNVTYYSNWQYKKWVCPVKKLTTPSITINKAKVKIKWGKSAGASGYQVQVSTSKSFKSLKVNTSGSFTSCVRTLKRKTLYYTRVRAYKNVSGRRVYGKWSSIKAFKTK